MADKEVKFTEEEMSQLTELQQTYAAVQNTLGQLSVSRIRLSQEVNGLDEAENKLRNDFVETQQKERDFVQEINKKYGDGNLDLTTGVFKPRVSTETTKETEKSNKTL